jgi:hypothetical protein
MGITYLPVLKLCDGNKQRNVMRNFPHPPPPEQEPTVSLHNLYIYSKLQNILVR